MLSAPHVLSVLSLPRDAGTWVWIAGGRGVDALVGEQPREHRDLDLLHRREQEPAVLAALGSAGFTEAAGRRAVRFVLAAPDGRELDLHPLVFAADGGCSASPRTSDAGARSAAGTAPAHQGRPEARPTALSGGRPRRDAVVIATGSADTRR